MKPQDMYALRVTDLWQNAALVRYVTENSRNLDVALQGGSLSNDKHWTIYGLPVTHVEVDDPLGFETMQPSPCMPELVYRASAVGILLAYVIGARSSLFKSRVIHYSAGVQYM
jgi:hypothetical protein